MALSSSSTKGPMRWLWPATLFISLTGVFLFLDRESSPPTRPPSELRPSKTSKDFTNTKRTPPSVSRASVPSNTTPHKRTALSAPSARKTQRPPGTSLLGRLPGGTLFVGKQVKWKHKGFHQLKGFRVQRSSPNGRWRPVLSGIPIHRIVTSQASGWAALVTTEADLYLRTPDGSLKRIYKRVGTQPQFSPSGKHLAFVHRQSITHHTLLWRDLTTGKEVALASRGPISDPVISPNEDGVIFASGITGIVSFWHADLKGHLRQLTNRGLKPGTGREPPGFVPPPTGRHPVLWARGWLVYDAGEALWAVREDGTSAHKLALGSHRPQWGIPGRSVIFFQNGTRMERRLQ